MDFNIPEHGGKARPDGALARVGAFVGQGEWSDPAGVLMVLEITSYDEDTDRWDRGEKLVAYAQAGVPPCACSSTGTPAT